MRRSLLSILLLVLALVAGWACVPDAPAELQVWERFERDLPIPVGPENPFDPNQVRVDVEFREPGGAVVRTPAFVHQDYDRTLRADGGEDRVAAGAPTWRVRFTPGQSGRWQWRWLRTTAAGVDTGAWQSFAVGAEMPAGRHGFIRRSTKDPRYFAFEDGTPFVPVGENLSWADSFRKTRAYEDWIPKLADAGATYFRLWMPRWDMGLVYPPATLEDWSARLDRAWQLDRVIELAEAHGLYVMLSVQNHGPFDLDDFFGSGWGTNLYNEANGGPLAEPNEIYTDEHAREIFRRYLRYVVARWGHSPNVFCWELWNEFNLTDQPASIDDVVAWHREMAQELDRLDPNQHLVTTSTSDELMTLFAWAGGDIDELTLLNTPIWELPEIDFVQLHSYQIAGGGVTLPVARTLHSQLQRMSVFGKPVLLAEAGVDFRGAAETLVEDPDGEGFHDIVWAGLFGGGFGSGMSWWWDSMVDPQDWYFHFAHLAGLIEGVAFHREDFEHSVGSVSGLDEVDAYVYAGKDTLLAWIKNSRHQYYAPDRSVQNGGQLELPVRSADRWKGRWIDPWTGATLGPAEISGASGTTIDVPPFLRDVALRLERVPSGPGKTPK